MRTVLVFSPFLFAVACVPADADDRSDARARAALALALAQPGPVPVTPPAAPWRPQGEGWQYHAGGYWFRPAAGRKNGTPACPCGPDCGCLESGGRCRCERPAAPPPLPFHALPLAPGGTGGGC